jgi:hypothetical protein
VRVEKGNARAPEIGRIWLNSSPLSFRQLRGRVAAFTGCVDPVASA